jgi:hypothetical protein
LQYLICWELMLIATRYGSHLMLLLLQLLPQEVIVKGEL